MIPMTDGMSINDANHQNKQPWCEFNITKNDNIYSARFNNRQFWKGNIAWINPPYDPKEIEIICRYMKRNQIEGYLCLPYNSDKYIQTWNVVNQTLSILARYEFTNCSENYPDIFNMNDGPQTFDVCICYVSPKKVSKSFNFVDAYMFPRGEVNFPV